MKRNKKIIFCLITSLSLCSPLSSWAYTFNVGPYETEIDVNDILEEVNDRGYSSVIEQTEERYGFSEDIWRAAKRKESAPRVEIFFDNTNPKPGEKVTAHAVPEFFKNDPQNLYYNWYIIHTTDGTPLTATNSVSDGKREAQGLMAHGDYDPDLDGQTYANSSADPDNDGWPAVDSNSYRESKVAAPMGGADGVGGLAKGNANIEPYDDANAYCATQGAHTPATCNLYTAKSSFNQYYNLQPSQSGDYCTSCRASMTFSATLSPTGSPAGSVSDPDNNCCYAVQYPTGVPAYDPGTSYCPTTYDSEYESCFDYTGLQTYNTSLIANCLNTAYQVCMDEWDNLHKNSAGDEPVSGVSRCYKHNFGTNSPDLGFRGYSGDTNSNEDDPSGKDVVTECKHKWKDAPGHTSGSGKFPNQEEKYWGTDPADPDTDGDGYSDEGDTVGLGQQDFSWTYQPGDRVGVVVEGTSMIPIDETSAYFKIMWGYLDVCDGTKAGLLASDECDGSGDYGYGFLATKSPSEQGDDKLKLTLKFSPDNPLADPSSENSENILSDGTIKNADLISVFASLDNTDANPSDLYYNWQIQKGDPKTNNWDEVTDITGNFATTSPSSGMGITQFNFSPRKDVLSGSDNLVYFKVTVTASRASNLNAGRGRASVVIPVNKNGIKISLYKIDIENGKAVVGEEVCNEGLYTSLCPAVKGQMLSARVTGSHYATSASQFSWKVNGSPFYPPADASQLFDGWGATTIFFPVSKEEQEIEEISVTASLKDELLPAAGTRLVTVVHPALFIKSADGSLSWPKIYSTQDPSQKATILNIESSNAYEALTNSNPSYYLDFVPYYLLGEDANSTIDWLVDGANPVSLDLDGNNPYLGQVELSNNDRNIKLPSGENEGTFQTLSASVTKYWSDDERGISYAAWGIAPDTLSGESTVSIESVSSATSDVVGNSDSPGQILAAVGTHLPHYFMYLLRLVLTLAVMFIVSVGFYALTLKLKFSDEEKYE